VIPARGPQQIQTAALRAVLHEKTARVTPSSLEQYLQCAFQYFGSRILRLREPPAAPSERLDFLTQGTIIHEVLAQWWPDPQQDIEHLFDRIFNRYAEEMRLPESYHSERLRNSMLLDLRAFALRTDWPRARFQTRIEEKFELPLQDDLLVSGRIDRLEVNPDGGAWVIDYKYSATQRLKDRKKDENLLQAQLYMLAAKRCFHLRPEGMFYLGLKGEVLYVGWGDAESLGMKPIGPIPDEWLERAEAHTARIVGEIRNGRIQVLPANTKGCRYCDFRTACRISTREAAVRAEGA
jgi:ATP-dependent helicase/DNAse subunit B